MLDDFFIRALIAGLGIAIVTGPLGVLLYGGDYHILVTLLHIQPYLELP